MAVNIKFYYTLIGMGLAASLTTGVVYHSASYAADVAMPVQACVVTRDLPLNYATRAQIAQCLGWNTNPSYPLCRGYYQPLQMTPLSSSNEIRIAADEVSFYAKGRSDLKGHVEVRQKQQIVNAQTAYIYRDAKTNAVTRIELLGDVRYLEPDRLMLAKKATIYPHGKAGTVEDVIYRFKTPRISAILPAWGRASWVQRFANKDYLLRKATYTTCPPQDKAWQIEAEEITLDNAAGKGIARKAVLRVDDFPLLYTPYLSFPTTNKRKSGFLMPIYGYSNVGGVDIATPYYWNMAPNYDATIVPHVYSRRGMMLGGDLRFLTSDSSGMFNGSFLPDDRAFNQFIVGNQIQYPSLRGLSNNRWSLGLHENTAFTPNLNLNVNYQQVSDDYYLQDFSTNLAVSTTNQLLRQGNITYTTDHWLFGGMAQSYQTLHPINQSFVSDIYERLPQLIANASYSDLPMNANFNMLAEFDYYRWPANNFMLPQGPRYHVNPILSFPYYRPWGYVTPSVQLVENYYDVRYIGERMTNSFNRTIPRYSIDSGLTFERPTSLVGHAFTQTLEPRLFYLNVPYHNQTPVPVYDSAYMIFNYEQLFRTNRFSGFDRIGDANQLAYALTSRWLSEESGLEKASFSVGQIRYFANRRVQLCYQQFGGCIDTPLFLGYVSPVAKTSPIASHASYAVNPAWVLSGDYVWDSATRATNNGNVNLHYQPAVNHIVNLGYTYLVDGNLILVPREQELQNNALHQASISYAWPLTERWSGLGVYSYNISKRYGMMTFVGFQYDNCCWAVRFMGGRTFKSISPSTLAPQYINNGYIQVVLKGLGSVGNSIPASTINTYLPGYKDIF